MKITYLFRRQGAGTYSIEGLFEPIAKQIPGADIIFVPFSGSSLWNIIRNTIYCRKRQQEINHITGDIHYVALGLRRRNLNVLTIHDCGVLFDTSKPFWKRQIIKYLWFVWPVDVADVVTTVSEKSKQEILKVTKCDASKVTVIPNYVHPRYQSSPKIFNHHRPRLLHIGSTKNKNLSRIIEAITGLHCELRIIGLISVTDQEQLLNAQIEYTQTQGLTPDQIKNEYHDCDIVLFVSTYEGFGLPILEAQATGRVVITSDISPCREIAGKEAIVVNPFSVADIKTAIVKLTSDESLRNHVIEAGFQNVKQYTLETIYSRYIDVYTNPQRASIS